MVILPRNNFLDFTYTVQIFLKLYISFFFRNLISCHYVLFSLELEHIISEQWYYDVEIF